LALAIRWRIEDEDAFPRRSARITSLMRMPF
jgi:hypothetical protein